MIKYLSIIFLLFSFLCEAKSTPNKKSCQFYIEKEKEVRCKKTEYDYLLGYGQKYCSEFLNLNKEKDSD